MEGKCVEIFLNLLLHSLNPEVLHGQASVLHAEEHSSLLLDSCIDLQHMSSRNLFIAVDWRLHI